MAEDEQFWDDMIKLAGGPDEETDEERRERLREQMYNLFNVKPPVPPRTSYQARLVDGPKSGAVIVVERFPIEVAVIEPYRYSVAGGNSPLDPGPRTIRYYPATVNGVMYKDNNGYIVCLPDWRTYG